MESTVDRSGLDRLEEALDVWLRYRNGDEGDSPEELLARHQGLRDLLEPMIGVRAGESRGDADPSPQAGLAGRVFDDFRLVREIGRGGMGVVFEARQLSLDRTVAVKILPSNGISSTKAVVRFKREALTAARLEHAGIVDVFAVGKTDEFHWFAMDLVDGVSLDEAARILRESAPDAFVQRLVETVAKVADALEHAHRAGVVHRDIKPSNILVRCVGSVRGDPDSAAHAAHAHDALGEPVLTDFGLAREEGLPSVSQTGEFKGTPYYVSPEQVRPGSNTVDHRADVFSLGVTLYELLTQKRPFDGDSTQVVLHSIVNREPPDPQKLNPDLTDDLAAVILKALEKDPERRYGSAAELAEDLRNFLAYRPVRAKRAGRLARLRRWARREPVKAGLYATLALGLPSVAGLAVYVLDTSQATSVGQRTIVTERVEELLLDAALSNFSQDSSPSDQRVRQALALAPDDPHVIGQCARYYASRKRAPERALALLDEHAALAAEEPGLRRVRAIVLRALDRDAEAAQIEAALGEPVTAFEHFVQAVLAMKEWNPSEPESARRALELAQRAVLLTERPRAVFFIQLKVAAIATHEKETELAASEALVRFWPRSAAAWLHVAVACKDDDFERAERACRESLKLRPDNLVGLMLLAELTDKRGDTTASAELVARARQLHPKFERLTLPRRDPHQCTEQPPHGSRESAHGSGK